MSLPETPPDSRSALDTRRRRLLFRATHRGTHEADLLVGGFVVARIAEFSETELDAVEAVLAQPDPALADWLIGRSPIPRALDSPMLRRMQAAARR
jgi:antitoxin CptB